MIFHENRLLADNSHEISYIICFRKLEKMSQNLSPAAVVIDALRVKRYNHAQFDQNIPCSSRFMSIFTRKNDLPKLYSAKSHH